jgi:hypothetical protein
MRHFLLLCLIMIASIAFAGFALSISSHASSATRDLLLIDDGESF